MSRILLGRLALFQDVPSDGSRDALMVLLAVRHWTTGRRKIKDTAGKVTCDKRLQMEGKLDKAKSSAHKVASDVKESV
jgi:hypothetical protein